MIPSLVVGSLYKALLHLSSVVQLVENSIAEFRLTNVLEQAIQLQILIRLRI